MRLTTSQHAFNQKLDVRITLKWKMNNNSSYYTLIRQSRPCKPHEITIIDNMH